MIHPALNLFVALAKQIKVKYFFHIDIEKHKTMLDNNYQLGRYIGSCGVIPVMG